MHGAEQSEEQGLRLPLSREPWWSSDPGFLLRVKSLQRICNVLKVYIHVTLSWFDSFVLVSDHSFSRSCQSGFRLTCAWSVTDQTGSDRIGGKWLGGSDHLLMNMNIAETQIWNNSKKQIWPIRHRVIGGKWLGGSDHLLMIAASQPWLFCRQVRQDQDQKRSIFYLMKITHVSDKL